MKSINLQKSAVAFALLLAMGSVGFSSAYGYGGSSGGTRANKVEICHNGNTIEVSARSSRAHLAHGDTEGVCEAGPQPLVLGASDSQGSSVNQVSPILTRLSILLAGVQSANDNGDISDEQAGNFRGQLGSIISALMSMLR